MGNRLQAELDRSTADMKKHLAEYKNLMNVKQSLEKEIDTYRNLLEGEEGRLSTLGSGTDENDSDSSESQKVEVKKHRVVIKTKDAGKETKAAKEETSSSEEETSSDDDDSSSDDDSSE